jgi:nucleotide-binding universal stress UspA family protein
MQKKLLVPVDGSIHSNYAARYVASLAARGTGLHCTLMHIQPAISQYLRDEARTDPSIQRSLATTKERNSAASMELLETCRDMMLREGVPQASVDIVSQQRMLGLAKDIIEYAHREDYTAIILGRRGLSRVQEVFMGSTSAKVVSHTMGAPVWIVDGEVRPSRLLVAVDHSKSAYQLVDYVGLICADIKDIHITFYRIFPDESTPPPFTSDADTIDAMMADIETQTSARFWPEVIGRLGRAGIDSSQLEMHKARRTGKVGKMILDEARQSNCDTVVVGRRGSSNAFYFGRASHYVTERLTERTVWVVG